MKWKKQWNLTRSLLLLFSFRRRTVLGKLKEDLQDIPADFINLKTKFKGIHIHHDRWKLSKVPVASKDGRHLEVVISLSSALLANKAWARQAPSISEIRRRYLDRTCDWLTVYCLHMLANKCGRCPLVHITVTETER